MKLNHLHLMVTDVRAASAFLETYFGLRSKGGNAGLAVLSDDDGFVLTLMKAKQTTNIQYPSNFPNGFLVESEARVDAINQRLRDDGYDVAPPERQHSYSFYVTRSRRVYD